jgi:transposase
LTTAKWGNALHISRNQRAQMAQEAIQIIGQGHYFSPAGLLSISGVGETLAGVVLAELPGPDVLRSSAEAVAYAGLNPRRHQSGTSIDRLHASPRSATPLFALPSTCRRCRLCDIVPRSSRS